MKYQKLFAKSSLLPPVGQKARPRGNWSPVCCRALGSGARDEMQSVSLRWLVASGPLWHPQNRLERPWAGDRPFLLSSPLLSSPLLSSPLLSSPLLSSPLLSSPLLSSPLLSSPLLSSPLLSSPLLSSATRAGPVWSPHKVPLEPLAGSRPRPLHSHYRWGEVRPVWSPHNVPLEPLTPVPGQFIATLYGIPSRPCMKSP